MGSGGKQCGVVHGGRGFGQNVASLMKYIQTGPETQAWTGSTVYVNDTPETLFTTPDGLRLIRCRNGETPDVIVESERGLPELQLRKWEGSKAYRGYLRNVARKGRA